MATSYKIIVNDGGGALVRSAVVSLPDALTDANAIQLLQPFVLHMIGNLGNGVDCIIKLSGTGVVICRIRED